MPTSCLRPQGYTQHHSLESILIADEPEDSLRYRDKDLKIVIDNFIMSSTRLPTTFTLFPALPFELRIKIYSFASQEPRIVTITYGSQSTKYKGKNISRFDGWKTPDPVPVILHVSRESRAEALKSYKPAFGSHFHPAKIYFDFSKDTLRFGNGHGADYLVRDTEWIAAGPSTYRLDLFLAGGYYGGDDHEKVQYMVLDLDEEVYDRRYLFWNEIRDFTALKELTILAWEEKDDAANDLMLTYSSTLKHDMKQWPMWVVPKTFVRSAITGTEWGSLVVEDSEVKIRWASGN